MIFKQLVWNLSPAWVLTDSSENLRLVQKAEGIQSKILRKTHRIPSPLTEVIIFPLLALIISLNLQ